MSGEEASYVDSRRLPLAHQTDPEQKTTFRPCIYARARAEGIANYPVIELKTQSAGLNQDERINVCIEITTPPRLTSSAVYPSLPNEVTRPEGFTRFC